MSVAACFVVFTAFENAAQAEPIKRKDLGGPPLWPAPLLQISPRLVAHARLHDRRL